MRSGVEISQVSQLFVNTVQTHNKASSHPIGVTSNHVVSSNGDILLWAWNIRTSRKPSASWCRGAWLWHAECAEFLEKATGLLAPRCRHALPVRIITVRQRVFHISSCAMRRVICIDRARTIYVQIGYATCVFYGTCRSSAVA